jgi:hypothetical protein
VVPPYNDGTERLQKNSVSGISRYIYDGLVKFVSALSTSPARTINIVMAPNPGFHSVKPLVALGFSPRSI